MELTRNEIIKQLVNSGGWLQDEAEEEAKTIFNEERYCHQCGNIYIVFESSAEGYWCPECGSSDSDE